MSEIMRDGWLNAWRTLEQAHAAMSEATTMTERIVALVNMSNASRSFQVACDGYKRALEGEGLVRAEALAQLAAEEIRLLRMEVTDANSRVDRIEALQQGDT